MIKKMLFVLFLFLVWGTMPACAKETSVAQYVEKELQKELPLYAPYKGIGVIDVKVFADEAESNSYFIAIFYHGYPISYTMTWDDHFLLRAKDTLKDLGILNCDITPITCAKDFKTSRREIREGKISNRHSMSMEETRELQRVFCKDRMSNPRPSRRVTNFNY